MDDDLIGTAADRYSSPSNFPRFIASGPFLRKSGATREEKRRQLRRDDAVVI